MSKSTRQSAILIAAYILTLVLNYAFGVALSWFITPAQYGVLGVAQSLLLLISMAIGSGFAWTANHDFAALGLNADSRRVFRASFIANSLLGFAIAALLLLIYATGWLPLGPAYALVIPFIGLTTIILASRAVLNGAARGLFLFTPVAVNLVAEVLVKILVGVALVAAGMGVPGVMLGFALGAAASLVHSLWMVRPAGLWSGKGWLQPGLLRKTAPLFIGMLSTALMLNLDVLGLKLLSPPIQGDVLTGYYQAVVVLSRSPVFIAQAITLVVFSYAAGSKALAGEPENLGDHPDKVSPDRDRPDTRTYFSSAFKAWFRMLLPVGVFLLLAPQAALLLFFPPAYQVTAGVLQICALGAIFLALVTLLNGVLQTTGERRRSAIATGLGILVQVLLLVLLVPAYGIWGPAISLLGGSAVALFFVWRAMLPWTGPARSLRQRLPPRWGLSLLPLLVLCLPLLLIPDTSRGLAALQVVLSAGFYALALYLVKILPALPVQGARRLPTQVLSEFVRVLLGG